MADPEHIARRILGELQDTVAAKDLDGLSRLFADEVVVFGTAAANLDRRQSLDYLALVVAQDGIVRWEWETVVPLVDQPGLLVFAVVGSVGFDDAHGQPTEDRDPFRLTCVAVEDGGRWRLRHFHGSVPQST